MTLGTSGEAGAKRIDRRLAVAVGVLLVGAPAFANAPPTGGALPGWDAYVRVAEARLDRQLAGERLSIDRAALARGEVRIDKVEETDGHGGPLAVPDAMVHHWRGTVFVPGASLDEVLSRVADPSAEDLAQEDVVAGRVLARGPGWLRVYLRLQRSHVVTVVYDTEHAVRYTRHSADVASSRSVATRIAEVAEPGTPRERYRGPGDDRGFLWRLNAYWRYEQLSSGVLVECESISLSRTVPALVRAALRPLIDRVARESMERTLLTLRARFARRPSHGARR
jgi:hypothetical protein